MITSIFPTIRTNKTFKTNVFKQCKKLGISYAQLVNIMLKQWLEGKIIIQLHGKDENGFTNKAKDKFLKRVKESENPNNLISYEEFVSEFEKTQS